jgi:hypothetical protein
MSPPFFFQRVETPRLLRDEFLHRGHQIPLDELFKPFPSFEVIRDAFITSVGVTRCSVPNVEFILPVTRSPKAARAPKRRACRQTSDRIGSFDTR